MSEPGPSPVTWAYRSRPLSPESPSGDAHVAEPFPEGMLLAVIDGLGHGAEAAGASQLAVGVLTARAAANPADLVRDCHAALRGSRGVAMLAVSLSFAEATARWVGIGNVEGWHFTAQTRVALISSAGVVGYQISPLHCRQARLAPGDLFALATDGISPAFIDDVRVDGDPDEMANAALTRYARPNDDAHVLIARYDQRGSQ